MVESNVVVSFPFLLRLFEMLSSIIVFAVVTEDKGSVKVNYVMFAGISGLVLSFFFMLFYFSGNKAIRGKFSAVIDVLWSLFWLAAAAVATSFLTSGWSTSQTRACCAFAWLTFVLWSVSAFISVREAMGFEY